MVEVRGGEVCGLGYGGVRGVGYGYEGARVSRQLSRGLGRVSLRPTKPSVYITSIAHGVIAYGTPAAPLPSVTLHYHFKETHFKETRFKGANQCKGNT